ncbi:MAG: pyridoxine 5'-phosphate synthase [Flavobacteriaceae bacterium]|nr:pyridoxine 5'-phosphate synthase [Muriicola sp.]MBT8291293.1 pyridoxine 5'-phosphate synthase [Muriicola sp.]NNK20895.1 pyridoxine 5'-phosphate synthase [Flavobacteriaceae bacterium]NNK36492.1 pyridoxine 5'-phosphate synthase [Eudoraea sp.]NNL38401.1 pyridoxine 5'-phosphate synthase [Flavobacteriaceae bacterium]
MTKLSVNINKIATLRNARGGNMPDLISVAKDIEEFGADGITVHPRPDERHIRYADVYALKKVLKTEFNIEGNPNPRFTDMVLEVCPAQVTLVPDAVDAITSNAGWDTLKHKTYLREMINIFKDKGIRTSIFVDPDPEMVKGAAETGTDRIELYTEEYAKMYPKDPEKAIKPYAEAAKVAHSLSLGINAGHDLSLENVAYFSKGIAHLEEVSIGHALICEAIYLGLENVVNMYLHRLK